MAYCREYASPLSFTDLACGLARMNRRAIKREPKQKGRPTDLLLSDHDLLASLMHYLSIAEAAYACNSVQFSLISHLPETAVLQARWKADKQSQSPAYVLAIDVVRQTVIVAVRGTAEPIDFLTTFAFKPEPFLGGFAHVGILQSARNILSAIRNDVHDALSRYPTLSVAITGHSLGGGVGALLALLMEQEVPEARVHCFAFSPPSCLSLPLARRSAPCVTSVAATHDIVPSLSVGSFNRLAKEFNTSGKSSVPSKSYDPGLDMYPPGAFLLVGWVDSTEGPDRRVRRPVLRPSEFFTRKMGINWTQAPSNVRWKVTQAQPEDFNNLTVSCWSWSDHMLTTVGEALRSVQSQSISRGEHLL
jgi:pimeloyl-ACP methyl ester carboxylesterase